MGRRSKRNGNETKWSVGLRMDAQRWLQPARAGFIPRVLTSPLPDWVAASLLSTVLVCTAFSSTRLTRLTSGEPSGSGPQRGEATPAPTMGDAAVSIADDVRLNGCPVSAEMLVPAAMAGDPTAGGVGEGARSASCDPALLLRAR